MHNETIVILFITVSFLVFVGYLLRRVSSGLIDVFDALSISIVLLVPLFFLLFEGLATKFSKFIGVEFPFVIMFGILLFIVFIILLGLFVRMKAAEARVKKLAQELALERIQTNNKKG